MQKKEGVQLKRVLVLLLVLLSLVSIASAEVAVDIATMTTEELVNLRNTVNAELAARNFKEKEVTVPVGRYTVGADIPVGVYTITRSGEYFSSIRTYTASGQYDLGFQVANGEPVGKLELSEGQTVEILYESVVFKPYTGLGF